MLYPLKIEKTNSARVEDTNAEIKPAAQIVKARDETRFLKCILDPGSIRPAAVRSLLFWGGGGFMQSREG
jgi:hypothetical protein